MVVWLFGGCVCGGYPSYRAHEEDIMDGRNRSRGAQHGDRIVTAFLVFAVALNVAWALILIVALIAYIVS